MKNLTLEDIVYINELTIRKHGGSSGIKNHGFNDRNKRVGCIVLLTLCHKNNILLKPSQQELINIGLGVASGTLGKDEIKSFILKHKSHL